MRDTTEWLIFGSGPSIAEYREQIALILGLYTVIAVNYRPEWVVPHYHMICNRRNYKKYKHAIHPKSVFVGASKVRGDVYFDFPNDYGPRKGWYTKDGIGGATVSMMAAAFAIAKGADTLHFVGLDGFVGPENTHWHRREKNFDRCLWQTDATRNILRDMSKHVTVKIHTPTVYEDWYESF